MPDGVTTDVEFLALTLARKHYEHLCRHEGDPLDLPWGELPYEQRQVWSASMVDLLVGLSASESLMLVTTLQAKAGLRDVDDPDAAA